MMLNSIAYLTCELRGRDLDSRLLIAAHLLKLGHAVVVGQQWSLINNAKTAPTGCFLFKTANHYQTAGMARVKRRGHAVVASDEEALPSNEILATATVDGATFQYCDLFLAINEPHRRAVVRAFPQAKESITITGSARLDLLRAIKTDRPHKRDYILLNTVFGRTNSVLGSVDRAVQMWVTGIGLDLNDPAQAQMVLNRLKYEEMALSETIAIIDWLIEATELDVVVRPHPAENPDFWTERYRDNARVLVVKKSDPVAWIQHARLLIHSDSTTGIEAALLGTPTINLSPDDAWAKRLILRDVNFSVTSAQQAKESIEEHLKRNDGPLRKAAKRDLFPDNCAEKTALAIASLLPRPAPLPQFKWVQRQRTDVQKGKFTVSRDECAAAIERIFPIAGLQGGNFVELEDSVFLLLS